MSNRERSGKPKQPTMANLALKKRVVRKLENNDLAHAAGGGGKDPGTPGPDLPHTYTCEIQLTRARGSGNCR